MRCSGEGSETFARQRHFLPAASAPKKLSRKARRICEQTVTPLEVSVGVLHGRGAKCSAGKCPFPRVDVVLPAWVEHINLKVLRIQAAHAYAVYVKRP